MDVLMQFLMVVRNLAPEMILGIAVVAYLFLHVGVLLYAPRRVR